MFTAPLCLIRPFRPLAAIAALGLLLAAPAGAEGLSLNADVGTLGAGVGLGYAVTDRVGLRASVNGLDVNRSYDSGGNRYDAALKLLSFDLLADWYFTEGFRLTGGALYNRNRADLRLLPGPGSSISLNGTDYPVAGARGQVDLGRKRLTPYVGIGWSSQPPGHAGLGFHADVGVVFQQPTVSIDVDAPAALLNDPAFQANRRAEEERLRDDLRFARTWPVISIGLNWGF